MTNYNVTCLYGNLILAKLSQDAAGKIFFTVLAMFSLVLLIRDFYKEYYAKN